MFSPKKNQYTAEMHVHVKVLVQWVPDAGSPCEIQRIQNRLAFAYSDAGVYHNKITQKSE